MQLRGSAAPTSLPVPREEGRQYFCRRETSRSQPCESPHCLECIRCRWRTCRPCEGGLIADPGGRARLQG